MASKTDPFSVSHSQTHFVVSSITIFTAITSLFKISIENWYEEAWRVVRALDLQFRGPEFKSYSDLLLDLFSVVVSSNPQATLVKINSQLARPIPVEILNPVNWLCIVDFVFLVRCTILTLPMNLNLILCLEASFAVLEMLH